MYFQIKESTVETRLGVGGCSVPRLLSTELITEEVLLATLESRCCRQIPPHTVRTASQLQSVKTQNFITLSPPESNHKASTVAKFFTQFPLIATSVEALVMFSNPQNPSGASQTERIPASADTKEACGGRALTHKKAWKLL